MNLRLILTALLAGALAVPAWAAVTRFPDVPADHPHARDIKLVAGRGWFRGYPDGSFHPDRTITPEQAAEVIRRAFGDDMTRGEFASLLSGGGLHLAALRGQTNKERERAEAEWAARMSAGAPTTTAAPATTTTAPPATTTPSDGFGSWRPGRWSQPAPCRDGKGGYCIIIPLPPGRPPRLLVGYRVINNPSTGCVPSDCAEHQVWNPRPEGGEEMTVPLRGRYGYNPSLLVSAYYQVGGFVLTEWRDVGNSNCPKDAGGRPLPFCYSPGRALLSYECPPDGEPWRYVPGVCRNDRVTGYS